MPDNENPTSPSGETTEAPLSLREIAENAYDDIVDASENAPEPVDTGGRQRDEYGRFARAEPGEAEAAKQPPSPDDDTNAPRAERPTQPQVPGVAAGPPENWSQADKDVFVKAPPEIQAWALRRHSEMEGDYQRRVQTYAQAAQFAQGVAPVFNDQRVSQSLQQWGISPQDAIKEWAGFHIQAIDPNPQVRAGFILDLAERIGVPLNPAAFGQSSPSGLPPEVAKDPAIKFFADYLGQISTEVQAVKARTGQMETSARQRYEQEAMEVTKRGIDEFAEMKDDKGNLLHPYFDEVIADIQEKYAANPRYNLREAYEKSVWSNPATREKMLQRQAQIAQRQLSDQRASQAARLNVRGRTSPVANGAIKHGPVSLRDTIEAAADELGM